VHATRPLAGILALATMALAVAGVTLAILHTAGPFGLFLLALAPVAAVLAWLALGAPVRRADIGLG
jgi:hypothetical protein